MSARPGESMRFGLTLLTLLARLDARARPGAALDDDTKPARTTDRDTPRPTRCDVGGQASSTASDFRLRIGVGPAGHDRAVRRASRRAAPELRASASTSSAAAATSSSSSASSSSTSAAGEGVWINKGDNVARRRGRLHPVARPRAGDEPRLVHDRVHVHEPRADQQVRRVPLRRRRRPRHHHAASLYHYDVAVQPARRTRTRTPGCVPGDQSPAAPAVVVGRNGAPRPRPRSTTCRRCSRSSTRSSACRSSRPTRSSINIEGGIRTMPFFGFVGRLLLLRSRCTPADVADAQRELLGVEVLGERDRELPARAGELLPLLRVDRAVLRRGTRRACVRSSSIDLARASRGRA